MNKKILIVDDDQDLLFVLEYYLNREGYEVISASGGKECLEKVRNENPDAVILDTTMPDVNRWDVCRIIKQRFPYIPASMCSILRVPQQIEKSLEAWADRYIAKPLSFEKLMICTIAMETGASTAKEAASGVRGK